MIAMSDLPHVNATLNGISALLLGSGFVAIRTGRRQLHRGLMIAAFVVSTAFLICYVIYHVSHGATRFPAQGWVRTAYLAMLASHVVLAATVPPLAVLALYRAHRGEIDRHRRIAAWAWPVWRSTVSTRLTPTDSSIRATARALIGSRKRDFMSWRL